MNRILKNKLLTFFIVLLLASVCAVTAIGTFATTETITVEQARASDAVNVATKDALSVSDNLREGDNYGITYANGMFTATGTGSWRRSATLLSNKFLKSELAVKDGQEVPTSAVTTYITATFNYSETWEYMNGGVLFGKSAIEDNGTRYYGLTVEPGRGFVFVYYFDVNANGEYIADSQKQGPVSYTPLQYAANTDYKIEILIKSNGMDVYVGGNEIATNYTGIYETSGTVVGIAPVLGLFWCDISMTLSDLSLRFLDAEAQAAKLTIADARESETENVAEMATLSVSDNLREGNDYGITYANGTFTATGAGSWSRSAILLSNKFLKSELAVKDGQEVPTSTVTTYITATFNYSEMLEYRNGGVLFGKSAIEDNGTRYYGLTVEPGRGFVFVYYFDVNANGEYITNSEKQGPVSYTPLQYDANIGYRIEILIKSNGMDVYVGGNEIATNYTDIYETSGTVVGITPVLGLSWCDISMTLSDLSLQFLDAEAQAAKLTIADARESEMENVAEMAESSVSDNLREGDNYGITYANGTFTATGTGSWRRSATLLSNKFLKSELAVKDGQEVPTSAVTTYITATFNYSETWEYMNGGVLFGKSAIEDNGTRYYGLTVEPGRGFVFVYYFDVNANGEYIADSQKQGPVSYSPLQYAANTDYKIEILIKSNGMDVYVGGNEIATNYTGIYETSGTVVGITPVLGLSWCDISMTLSDLSLRFLDAEAKTAVPKFTIEQARLSQAENIVKAADITASNNFREGDNYGITFADGKFSTTATNNWSRAAMKLKSAYLNSQTVIMDGEKVESNQAAAYISVKVTFTAVDEYKNIGTLIGLRENENSYTYYAAVVSFSQKIVFIYTFDTDMAGNYIAGSELQGPASYNTVDISLNETYKLEVVLNPKAGITVAWNETLVCEDLQSVPETGKSLLSLTPVIGLSWADMSGSAEDFVLKYLNAEVVPEKSPETEGPVEEPKYPEKEPDPEINTEIIIPDVYRPEESGGCQGSIDVSFATAVPLLGIALLVLLKRRKVK